MDKKAIDRKCAKLAALVRLRDADEYGPEVLISLVVDPETNKWCAFRIPYRANSLPGHPSPESALDEAIDTVSRELELRRQRAYESLKTIADAIGKVEAEHGRA